MVSDLTQRLVSMMLRSQQGGLSHYICRSSMQQSLVHTYPSPQKKGMITTRYAKALYAGRPKPIVIAKLYDELLPSGTGVCVLPVEGPL